MKGTYVAVAVMCLIWGSTWFVLREGLEEMEPLGSAALRFLVAGAFMVPFAGWLGRVEGGASPPIDLVLAMATGNVALSFGIVYWAEQVVPSGLAAVLWAVFPIMTAIVGSVMLPGSRLVGWQWFGLLIGFVGVAVLFATDVQAVGGEALKRSLILLLSPLVSAIATAYVKKHGKDVSSALLNRAGFLTGGAMLTAAAFLVEGGLSVPSSPRGVFSVLYLALIGTILAFTLYFWVLRTSSALSLSLITYVTPIVALVIGAQLGEEPVTLWTVGGLALVLVGCGFVLRRPRPDGDV